MYTGKHAHLRPRFNLEDADRVGLADHFIDLRILGRQGGQRE